MFVDIAEIGVCVFCRREDAKWRLKTTLIYPQTSIFPTLDLPPTFTPQHPCQASGSELSPIYSMRYSSQEYVCLCQVLEILRTDCRRIQPRSDHPIEQLCWGTATQIYY